MAPLPERIESPRLTIRRWRRADAGALAAIVAANIEHLRPWMPWVAAEPLDEVARLALIAGWEDDWSKGGDALYAVIEQDRLIGSCGLHRRSTAEVLEIGYWIGVEHVGRGFATEVARAVTTAALAVPGVDVVEIRHDRANVRSAAVPRKLGFTFIGESPRPAVAPGEIGVGCGWRTTRADWPAPELDPDLAQVERSDPPAPTGTG